MNILCFNTAFPMANVVLESLGEFHCETLSSQAKTSESVLPCIENLLSESELSPRDLDYLGVVIGTGSFTGVRIGVALAKGFMAVNKNLKTVAINSLSLMAFQYYKAKNAEIAEDFYCVQNALSGRFFVAKFNRNGEEIESPQMVNTLPDGILVGLECEDLSETTEKVEFDCETLLEYTKFLISKQSFKDIKNLTPLYLRLSQAEENLINKENKNA